MKHWQLILTIVAACFSVHAGFFDLPADHGAAKAADNLLMVDGVQASFALLRLGEVVHISARSAGSINVQLIMEEMGGGGHFDGAAAQIREQSMDDVLASLKNAIDKIVG